MHLLTITAGLLIAIALEQSVEWMHHRHQRHEAEEKIREEIRGNLKSLMDSEAMFHEEIKTMIACQVALKAISKGNKAGTLGPELKPVFHEEEIPNSAWETAKGTGVLEYMPYDEVETFADAYREQALLQQMAQKTLEDYLELAPLVQSMQQPGAKVSPEDAKEMLPSVMRTLGHLSGIYAAGVGTRQSYENALK